MLNHLVMQLHKGKPIRNCSVLYKINQDYFIMQSRVFMKNL